MSACLNCLIKIKGRSDKKFCSPHCRSAHYFKRNALTFKLIKEVNQQLKINRQILIQLQIKRDLIVPKHNLKLLGFDLSHCTQVMRNENSEVLKYCYDMVYVDLNEYEILIPKKSA